MLKLVNLRADMAIEIGKIKISGGELALRVPEGASSEIRRSACRAANSWSAWTQNPIAKNLRNNRQTSVFAAQERDVAARLRSTRFWMKRRESPRRPVSAKPKVRPRKRGHARKSVKGWRK